MKKYIGLLLILGSCAPSVVIFIDKDLDFIVNDYSSYTWKAVAPAGTSATAMYDQVLTEKRIRHAVDSVMNKKGYHLDETTVALQLHYHITVENKAAPPTQPSDYETSTYWVGTETDSYECEEGTLIIDVVDPASGCLVWRSRAVAILNDLHRGNVQRALNKAAAKMLKTLPVAPQSPTPPIKRRQSLVVNQATP
ncbi:MAG TPA: DUF4136 domain-containing protein [Chryseolinea sp.]